MSNYPDDFNSAAFNRLYEGPDMWEICPEEAKLLSIEVDDYIDSCLAHISLKTAELGAPSLDDNTRAYLREALVEIIQPTVIKPAEKRIEECGFTDLPSRNYYLSREEEQQKKERIRHGYRALQQEMANEIVTRLMHGGTRL